jgi:hypothetical protein
MFAQENKHGPNGLGICDSVWRALLRDRWSPIIEDSLLAVEARHFCAYGLPSERSDSKLLIARRFKWISFRQMTDSARWASVI